MRQTCFASALGPLVSPALPPALSVHDFFAGPFGLAIQERTAWAQLPAAILILLSPVACLVLFAISLRRTASPSLRQRCTVAVLVLPLVALALYVFYESEIPPEMNIRIDLLLIYPALVLDFLFWPTLLVRYLIYRRA
jgi:hypothetical protein